MLRHDHPTSTAWRRTLSASSPPPPHTCAHHQRAWEEEGERLWSNTDQSTGKCAHLPFCCRNSAHELDSALIFISTGTPALGNRLFIWSKFKKTQIWKLHQVCYGEFIVANSPIFGCWTITTLTTSVNAPSSSVNQLTVTYHSAVGLPWNGTQTMYLVLLPSPSPSQNQLLPPCSCWSSIKCPHFLKGTLKEGTLSISIQKRIPVGITGLPTHVSTHCTLLSPALAFHPSTSWTKLFNQKHQGKQKLLRHAIHMCPCISTLAHTCSRQHTND